MATPTRPCPYCGAAVLMNASACGTCGRPMPPLAASAPPAPLGPTKTMFGYAAPSIPLPHRVQRPHGTTAPPGTAPQSPAPEAPAPAPQPVASSVPEQSYNSPSPQPYAQPFAQPSSQASPADRSGAGPADQSQGSFGAQPAAERSQSPMVALASAGRSVPLDRLRDSGLQQKVLLIAGIALLATIVVPYSISPTIFPWQFGSAFDAIVWPLIAGAAYLLVTVAPPDLRKNIPPIVLQWLPFAVPVVGILVAKTYGGLYTLGYATLVVGLLVHIARPSDRIARIVICVGAGMLVPNYFDALSFLFHFGSVGVLGIVHNLVWFVIWTAGILCILFVVPSEKLPPALRVIDSYAPLICTALIVWLPVQVAFMTLGLLGLHAATLLMFAHAMIRVFAFFGVLIVTGPPAYERIVAMFSRQQAAQG